MRLPLLAIAFALAACDAPTSGARGGAPAAEAPTAPGLVTDPRQMPASFQGLWAAMESECAAGETRLEIAARRLTFHESSGEVALVEETGTDEIRVTVPLRGEGSESQRTFRYRLIEDGQALFDVRNGLTRRRCPG